ncbi:MAG TPA: hypothetical protein PLV68_03395 [Ilumatobacteraceae bacterium]|nr:hypothetical protein [Ilumatobacteraceae bacterium]
MATDSPAPHSAAPDRNGPPDPVRARRARVAKWNGIVTRVGYALFGIAMVLFFVALATGFNSTMGTLIAACLIVGSILLAPAIVIGYAVKAAEKDDVARGL